MIPKPDLLKIARSKIKDAEVLLANRRYATAIYIAGYSIEVALKYRICMLYQFRLGFPENPGEFNTYFTASTGLLKTVITDIRQIKIHNLSILLRYSGKELPIQTGFATEWSVVNRWTPLNRYSVDTVRKAAAENFLNATRTITNELF